ncbi:glycosyltransferase family A protein [Pedobacter sp. KR3-3]|uniref:Glycosyltransferase family A protein n=1 Tax=Pedobacter albus TaxID=3113905 RepID=A0ABU7I723_9SPHI|nr:glycosyltransferase family A protein [Pedobacter sp. KR3-3]MEE1945141.1 glycosyltransferase family A protein [Pedobacter sp. KR3-3]
MANPLISVIIPAYNAEKYIGDTLNSVLSQTYAHLEIIVVNDGSTDETLAKVQSFSDDRIKIVSQVNSGASSAKQLGLAHIHGEFVQYLDADDLLSEDKIEVQVKALANHPHKIAVCSTVHFHTNESYTEQLPSPYEDGFLYSTDDPASFLINLWGGNGQGGSMIQPNAFLTPAAVIEKAGPWNLTISPCADEDGEYFCRAILASDGLVFTPKALNYYRKFDNKNSLSALKSYQSLLNLYRSTLLKADALFAHTRNETAKFVIARQLIELAVSTYPKHASLSKQIRQEVKKLGNYSYTPISGGPTARKLSLLLGWKLTRLLQSIITAK